MLLIDKFAYINRLKDVHPVEKITGSLTLLLFSLSVRDILVSLITFLVMSAFIIIGAKIPLSYYLKLLLLPALFLLSSIAMILISITREGSTIQHTILSTPFGPWQLVVTEQSLLLSVELLFVVLSSVSCLYFLTLTTSVQAILYVLRKGRVPFLLLEIIELIYRFIFVFLEEAERIYRAQHARLGYLTIKQWIYSLSLLVTNLLNHGFKRTKELTTAMQSRGDRGEFHFIEYEYSYSARNWLILFFIFTLEVLVYFRIGGIF